jgi:hypothetical protein
MQRIIGIIWTTSQRMFPFPLGIIEAGPLELCAEGPDICSTMQARLMRQARPLGNSSAKQVTKGHFPMLQTHLALQLVHELLIWSNP